MLDYVQIMYGASLSIKMHNMIDQLIIYLCFESLFNLNKGEAKVVKELYFLFKKPIFEPSC